MAELKPITFDYKEVVTALLKQQGIHTGIWALYIEFGFAAVNMPLKVGEGQMAAAIGPEENQREYLRPLAMIPIQCIGIVPAKEVTAISVDAAKVNPKPKGSKSPRKTPTKK